MWLVKKINIFFGVFFDQNRSNFFAPLFLNQMFCGLDARAYGYIQTFPKNHSSELRALQTDISTESSKSNFLGSLYFTRNYKNYGSQERCNDYNISSITVSEIQFLLRSSYQLLLYIMSTVECEAVIVEHLQLYYYDYLSAAETRCCCSSHIECAR